MRPADFKFHYFFYYITVHSCSQEARNEMLRAIMLTGIEGYFSLAVPLFRTSSLTTSHLLSFKFPFWPGAP